MKKILLYLLLFCATVATAQQATYSRAKIKLSAQKSAFQLARLGVDITHGDYAPAKHFISAFSSNELERIRAAGFEMDILIPDLYAHFLEQQNQDEVALRDEEDCTNVLNYDSLYVTPTNYTYGSMGGYLTYDEMLMVLDQMVSLYPNLITEKTAIPNIQTIEGNDIYWLRISDNPNTDETDEPEVLYTALHHAREPNSLSQMIFYMWYILENYGTDAEITNLIDKTEMYFIPCINVDGYKYNELTNPQGGGMWRKNRRDNGDGNFGVDLNRNYGYEWGYDNTGSSPNTDSNTYRGTEGFSEPETQAVKAFCEAHSFELALNYHTYGNLLIYPWGFSDTPTPDFDLYQGISIEMIKENNYKYGTGIETVGYTVNGDSDDWMYGEQTTKPKTFSLTPEAGSSISGFWPTQDKIDVFNKSCMHMNLTMPRLTLNYGTVKETSNNVLVELAGNLSFKVQRLGFREGTLTVSALPISDNITITGDAQVYNLELGQSATGTFTYALGNDINIGDEVKFKLLLDNGDYVSEEIVSKVYFDGMSVFVDQAADLGNWTATTWGLKTSEFYSAPSCFADSPDGTYGNNVEAVMTMNEPVKIYGSNAFLRFLAKWDIEDNYDYGQVSISVNGGNYQPLCGAYTNTAQPFQLDAAGTPIYDGIKSEWVKEEIDLSQYLTADSSEIKIRFVLKSDGFANGDGFNVDDIEVIGRASSTAITNLNNKVITYKAVPNPASTHTIIELSENVNNAQIEIYDVLGKSVLMDTFTGNTFKITTEQLQSGIYFYELTVNGYKLKTEKIEVLK